MTKWRFVAIRARNACIGLLLMALCLATAAGCGGPHKPSDGQLKANAAALASVLPILAVDGLENFRDLEWCRSLKYRRGAFSSDPNDSTCNLFSGPARGFDPEASSEFGRIQSAFKSAGIQVIGVDRYRGPTGVQLMFDVVSGGNDRWSYVYEPGYRLPSSDPAELVATRIDGDWYFMWQDWN